MLPLPHAVAALAVLVRPTPYPRSCPGAFRGEGDAGHGRLKRCPPLEGMSEVPLEIRRLVHR